jgi:hypothetical protein
LLLPGDKVLVLDEDPRADEAALLAFLGGHCHSLALALHQETMWPLVAVVQRNDGVCVHVAARRADGKIVDIAGAHTGEEIHKARNGGVSIREVTVLQVHELHEQHGWAKPVPDVVAPWVQIALDQAAREPRPPMATATFTCSRTTESGIEACVTWDGEPYFCVDVRSDNTNGPWKRYGRAGFRRDADGLYRYSFTLEWFRPLAEAWLERQFDETRAAEVLAT